MVTAYVLIQTTVGKSADVTRAMREIPGVTHADDVTGPYDVIVCCQADDVDQLGRMVISQVQNVPGITRTVTCPVVHP